MRRTVFALMVPTLFALLLIASDAKLEGVKCVMSGEPVNASVSTDYKDGKVYFCCANCVKNFNADTAKYSTKANHQLVATGQAKQTSCPLSGGQIAQDKFVEVNGAKVYFCCDTCKGKVTSASGDEQLNMVFSDAAWKKSGYKVGS